MKYTPVPNDQYTDKMAKRDKRVINKAIKEAMSNSTQNNYKNIPEEEKKYQDKGIANQANKTSTQNEVLYTAWYCPNGGEKYKAHFVCHMATQKDIDRHLMECTLAKSQDKPYPGKFIPVDRLPEASKTLQEDHEHDYVMDILMIMGVMTTATQYGKIDKILTKLRADARKEVIKRIEAMPDKDVRPQITVWLESKEYCLGYNKALSNVLATLREEEKHG